MLNDICHSYNGKPCKNFPVLKFWLPEARSSSVDRVAETIHNNNNVWPKLGGIIASIVLVAQPSGALLPELVMCGQELCSPPV